MKKETALTERIIAATIVGMHSRLGKEISPFEVKAFLNEVRVETNFETLRVVCSNFDRPPTPAAFASALSEAMTTPNA